MNHLFRLLLLTIIAYFTFLLPAHAQTGVLGRDTAVCTGTTLLLNATTSGGTYFWDNASTGATRSVTSGTAAIKTYWVEVTVSGITTRDSIRVQFMTTPASPSTSSPVYGCIGQIALSATAPSGAGLLWYTTATGGAPIGLGTPFLYNLTGNTTLYVESANLSTLCSNGVGYTGAGTSLSTVNSASPAGEIFDVFQPIEICEVTIIPEFSGSVKIELRNSLNQVLNSATRSVAANIGNNVSLGFKVLPGTDYRLVVSNSTAGRLKIASGLSGVYPYTLPNQISIKKTTSNSTTQFLFMFNWKINTYGCKSVSRVPVSITAYSNPSFSLNDTIVCGNSAVLDMGNQGATATYLWSPGGQTTQSITVPSSAGSGSYTATATINHPNNVSCSNSRTVNLIFSSQPSTPTGNNVTTCQGNVNLSVTSSAPRVVWTEWNNGSNFLGSGNTLAYNATTTDTLYAQAFNLANIFQRVGYPGLTASSTNTGSNLSNTGLVFNVIKPLSIDSVTIYPKNSGFATIVVENSAGVIVASKNITIPAITTSYEKVQVYLGFTIGKGTGYKLLMKMNNLVGFKQQNQAVYPQQIPAFLSITGASGAGATVYPIFYDWVIRSLTCGSTPKSILVTVNPSPPHPNVSDTTSCSGAAITLDMGSLGTGITYQWKNLTTGQSPATGPTTTITTGFAEMESKVTLGGCSVRDTINVQVFANISNPTVSGITTCAGPVNLTANAGNNQVLWWDAATGGNVLGAGSPFTYSVTGNSMNTTTTTVYAQSYGLSQFTQQIGNTQANVIGSASNTGLRFSVQPGKSIIIEEVKVQAISSNITFKVELQNSAGVILNSKQFTLGQSTNGLTTLNLGFFVYEGTGYRLLLKGTGTVSMGQTYAGASISQYPYDINGVMSIYEGISSTGGAVTNRYYNFYDWTISVLPCQSSGRAPLNITVLKSPDIDLGDNVVTCSPPVVKNLNNPGATYSWTVTGSSYTGSTTNQTLSLTNPGLYNLRGIASVTNTGAATCRDTGFVSVNIMTQPGTVTAPAVQNCGGSVTLNASSSNSDQIVWWSAATGGNVIGAGSPVNINFSASTTVYAQAFSTADLHDVVGLRNVGASTLTGTVINKGQKFTVGNTSGTSAGVGGVYIDSVTVYAASAGAIKINMVDAVTGAIEASVTYNTLPSPFKTVIPLGFFAKKGDHALVVATNNTLLYEGVAGGFYVATNPDLILNETGTTTRHIYISGTYGDPPSNNTKYFGLYDWKVRIMPLSCATSRQGVNVTILPTPVEFLPSDTVKCSGTVQMCMTSPGAAYSWVVDPLPLGNPNAAVTTSCVTINQPSLVYATATYASVGCSFNKTISVDISSAPSAPVVSDTTVCPGWVQLSAVSNGDYVVWYDEPTGGSQVGGGATFDYLATDPITLYAQSYNLGHFANAVGIPAMNSATYANTSNRGLVFDVTAPIIIDSVSIFPDVNTITGTIQIRIYQSTDSGETIIYTRNWNDWSNVVTVNGKYMVRVPLNFFLAPNALGTSYSMRMSSLAALNVNGGTPVKFGYESNSVATSYYPLLLQDAMSLNAGFVGTSLSTSIYYYFYDWAVRAGTCFSARVPMNIDLYPAPTHSVTLGTDFTKCGDTVLVGGNFPNGYTYLWNTSATTQTLPVTQTNTYWLGVFNLLGCGVYDTVNVTINPLPVAFASYSITNNNPLTLSFNNAGSSFGTYLWTFGGGTPATSSLPSPTHTYPGPGPYTVTFSVTNSCGVSDTSFTVQAVGIDDGYFKNITVYPNPSQGTVKVEFSENNLENIRLSVVNLLGQNVVSRAVNLNGKVNYTEVLELNHLNPGVYYLIFESEGHTHSQKIVIQQ